MPSVSLSYLSLFLFHSRSLPVLSLSLFILYISFILALSPAFLSLPLYSLSPSLFLPPYLLPYLAHTHIHIFNIFPRLFH